MQSKKGEDKSVEKKRKPYSEAIYSILPENAQDQQKKNIFSFGDLPSCRLLWNIESG